MFGFPSRILTPNFSGTLIFGRSFDDGSDSCSIYTSLNFDYYMIFIGLIVVVSLSRVEDHSN